MEGKMYNCQICGHGTHVPKSAELIIYDSEQEAERNELLQNICFDCANKAIINFSKNSNN